MELVKLMQEVEVSDFPTKKELITKAERFAKDLVDSGEHNPQELFSQVVRLKEVINALEGKLRKEIPQESFEAFGLKVSYSEGGNSLNYKEDHIVADLERQLKERKDLIKVANSSSQPIYDAEGVQVDKVSTTPRKSSLRVTF